jgi:thioester reductase-like protein
VHRADDIIGSLATGVMNTVTELCALIRYIADSGEWPDVDLELDFVPADSFGRAVAHIAATRSAPGEVYHLTNPAPARLPDLAERLRARGYRAEPVPYPDWVRRLVEFTAEHPAHPMTPFAPLFVDRCSGADLSISEMYFHPTLPYFERTRTEQALRGTGLDFPPVDAALLDRYLDGLRAAGFLDPPAAGPRAPA